MRILDKEKIDYKAFEYPHGKEAVDGLTVARLLDEDPKCAFKTLVTQAKSGQYYVFVIPVASELDLKKAAKACGEKAISMIKQKELLPLTGYVHGGCSPIGMKKPFPTYIDWTAEYYDTVFVSAGRVGCQIELAPADLIREAKLQIAELTEN